MLPIPLMLSLPLPLMLLMPLMLSIPLPSSPPLAVAFVSTAVAAAATAATATNVAVLQTPVHIKQNECLPLLTEGFTWLFTIYDYVLFVIVLCAR